MRKILLSSLLLVFLTVISFAGELDPLKIKLVTVDPGADLTTWWGHTGVIVEDAHTGSGRFYNYGLFSFDQENFMLNFARGRLIFWVGVWDADLALKFYKSMDRTIRVQTLDLPAEKKQAIADFLAWNVLPANREYLYDHYYDNCATRVRDLLDRELDGAFYKNNDRPARWTLREHTRRHTHRSYLMDWLLMFLMNDSIDKPIRQWDEMFLPTELERDIAAMMITGNDGKTRPLVLENQLYYQATDAYQVPEEPPRHWPVFLITGILLAAVSMLMYHFYQKDSRPAKNMLGSVYILTGLLFGIPGLVLFLMSLFTNHIVTFYNENLFLANPLTLLLVFSGIGLIRGKQAIHKYMPYLSLSLAVPPALLLCFKFFAPFDQDNWISIAVICPFLFSLAWNWCKNIFVKNQIA